MLVSLLLTLLAFGALIAESLDLRRRVRRIPLRVHVNGTRGKSSVTEYIAAGLRASNRRVLAKITGVRPTVIRPDGTRRLIARRGAARVQEQAAVIREAFRYEADAIVLECMSILPEYQRLESRMLRPHITVITNVRNDHNEEMGRSFEEQFDAMCSSVPAGGTVVTAERAHLEALRAHVHRTGGSVRVAAEHAGERAALGPTSAFGENVAVALEVCEIAGVERAVALQAIRDYVRHEEQGTRRMTIGGKEVRFVNGFAVNDTPSAAEFLESCRARMGTLDPLLLMFNTRADRPLRTDQFARWMATLPGTFPIVLAGTHVPFARRALERYGVAPSRISCWSRRQVASPADALNGLVQQGTTILGLGNIVGDGFALMKAFEERDGHGH